MSTHISKCKNDKIKREKKKQIDKFMITQNFVISIEIVCILFHLIFRQLLSIFQDVIHLKNSIPILEISCLYVFF
jgi:hypothetical protein